MLLQITAESLVLYPLVIALLLIVSPWRSENAISRLVFFGNLVNGFLTISLAVLYAASGFKAVEIDCGHLITAADYHFTFMLLIDKYSVAFQLLIGILTGLVLMFSRRYMHRETGYIRFFASLFLFVAGISLGGQAVAQAAELGLDVVLREVAADLGVDVLVLQPLPAGDRRLAGEQVLIEGLEIVADRRVDAEAGDDDASVVRHG